MHINKEIYYASGLTIDLWPNFELTISRLGSNAERVSTCCGRRSALAECASRSYEARAI